MRTIDVASTTPLPVEDAISGAIKALNTAPSFHVPSLGTKASSYDAVRHLENALPLVSQLIKAAGLVCARWSEGDLAEAVRALSDAASASGEGGRGAADLLAPFTVIGYYAESGQIFAEHVEAQNGTNAFAVAAAMLGEGAEFTGAVAGWLEEDEAIWFPGESVVDSDTVASQPEVFGNASDVDGEWAIGVVERAGFRLVEATEPEVAGRWDWVRASEGSDVSFDTREEAARDALEAFAPFDDWKWEVDCDYTRRSYREWAESKADQEADQL